MDFIIALPILVNKKSNSYNLILVKFEHLTKMIYYKPIKVTINILALAKIIIDMVICYHGIFESIVIN